ncbi:MAG: aspartyl protease family protein, partial [Proteobacteria bacterium]|nr:aspartyl protease family protein [Pseudomonadota bacterium]
DTGAFNSLVRRNAAERYGLPVRPLRGLTISGVGGSREAQATTVKELKLGDQARRDVQLLMGGFNQPSSSRDFAMLLGQDILSRTDLEIDLANNIIRFLKPVGCGPNDSLAYWGGTYAEARIEPVSRETPHIITTAQVNGRPVRAMLDTGAWTTVLSSHAAGRAGMKPGAAEAAGQAGGMGKRKVATSLATFDTLTIGDQTVKNAKLRVADLFRHSRTPTTGSRLASSALDDSPDLIIGADFFRSHRVLVSYSQRRIYFTHNGRQIFQVEGPPLEEDAGNDPVATEAPEGPQASR